MSHLVGRLAALEKAAGTDLGPPGTIEWHMSNGSDDPRAIICDKRNEPDHAPDCVFTIAMHTHDGVRFMRIVGFDPAGLD